MKQAFLYSNIIFHKTNKLKNSIQQDLLSSKIGFVSEKWKNKWDARRCCYKLFRVISRLLKMLSSIIKIYRLVCHNWCFSFIYKVNKGIALIILPGYGGGGWVLLQFNCIQFLESAWTSPCNSLSKILQKWFAIASCDLTKITQLASCPKED